MVKNKFIFSCQICGTLYPKWSGQCSGCGEWNTIVEELNLPTPSKQGYTGTSAPITRMADVELQAEMRHTAGSQELDRVLGGGIIMGSAILIGGDQIGRAHV